MSKRNPIERSQYINSQYKEYLRSSFEFKTPKLQKLFEQQLKDEDLFKGPYVDLNLPFKRGMSLDGMIADGAVCKSFRKLGDMNFERHLLWPKRNYYNRYWFRKDREFLVSNSK